MKNLFKAHIAQILGIIALVAVIGFTLTACDLEPEETVTVAAPKGTVSITPSEFGSYPGFELTASYQGSETVEYMWFTGNATFGKDGDDSLEDGPKFTPTTAGTYKVIVIDMDAINAVKDPDTIEAINFKSTNITILELPAHGKFFGEWIMKGSEQTPSVNYDEEIKITNTKFYLEDNSATPKEYLDFAITSWATSTKTPTGNKPTDYTTGWTLTGTTTANNGYWANSPTNTLKYTSFDLWTNDAGVTFYRTTQDGAAILLRLNKKK